MTIHAQIADNGVNTEALIGARGAFAEMPQHLRMEGRHLQRKHD